MQEQVKNHFLLFNLEMSILKAFLSCFSSQITKGSFSGMILFLEFYNRKKIQLLLKLELWPLSGKRMKMRTRGELFGDLKQTAEV